MLLTYLTLRTLTDAFLLKISLLDFPNNTCNELFTMIRSQVLLLKPTKQQELLFRGAAGLRRFAWNWALAFSKRYYGLFKKSISAFTLQKRWNKIKDRCFPWVKEYSKFIAEDSFKSLEKAMKSFFRRLKKGGKPGFPKFKKRGLKESFNVVPANQFPIKQYGKRFRIPRVGKVRFCGNLRWPDGKQLTGQVSQRAGKWYLSLTYELSDPPKLPSNRPSCGVDLGCKTFATIVSNGQLIQSVEPPKPYARAKRKLRRFQRVLSRRKKGSKRRDKAKLKVAVIHKRISDFRKNFLHQLTSRLVKTYGKIGIEDLAVQAMARGFLSGTIHDMGFYEFCRQLEYKAETAGTKIVVADRYYPSSKTCNCCGAVNKDLTINDRQWTCSCGANHNRDVNAAINLEKLPQGMGKVTLTETRSSLARKS